MAKVTFRYAHLTRQDVDSVMEVERRCFDSPWTPGQFRHELKVPFSRTILAWDDGVQPRRIAGYICRWGIGDEFSILNLAVDPDYRRHGLGRALVNIVLEEASSAGAASVTLEVRENNDAARSLYEGLGFTRTGLRKDYYGKADHAIIMTKMLPAPAPAEEALGPTTTEEYT